MRALPAVRTCDHKVREQQKRTIRTGERSTGAHAMCPVRMGALEVRTCAYVSAALCSHRVRTCARTQCALVRTVRAHRGVHDFSA